MRLVKARRWVGVLLLTSVILPAENSFAAPMPPSEERVSESLRALRARDAERHRRILSLREESPKAFAQEIYALAREEQRLAKVRKSTPANGPVLEEMWRNRERLRGLALSAHRAEDAGERDVIHSQVESLLRDQYRLREQMRVNRLRNLEARAAELRRSIGDARGNRDQEKFVADWRAKLLAKQESSGKQAAGAKRQ